MAGPLTAKGPGIAAQSLDRREGSAHSCPISGCRRTRSMGRGQDEPERHAMEMYRAANTSPVGRFGDSDPNSRSFWEQCSRLTGLEVTVPELPRAGVPVSVP